MDEEKMITNINFAKIIDEDVELLIDDIKNNKVSISDGTGYVHWSDEKINELVNVLKEYFG